MSGAWTVRFRTHRCSDEGEVASSSAADAGSDEGKKVADAERVCSDQVDSEHGAPSIKLWRGRHDLPVIMIRTWGEA